MTEMGDITEPLGQVLPLIDRYLADQDVPPSDRPLPAAIEFVSRCIEVVRDQGGPPAPPGDRREFLAKPWFALLYAHVDEWYHDRYQDAMQRMRDNRIFGIVMIAGTVFGIRVPSVRRRPGRPGETTWISFPDGLREGEYALDWIDAPPKITMLSAHERNEAEVFAADVAGSLRFIRTGLNSVRSSDRNLAGIKAGVMPRLRRAAELLLEPGSEAVQLAYWEIQLACETALKALLQQRTGAFPHTHDLFELHDRLMPSAPAFNRDLIKRMPRWKETMELRYGQGARDSRAACVECYRVALRIVAGTVQSMERLGIGNAEFEIGQVPWALGIKALPT